MKDPRIIIWAFGLWAAWRLPVESIRLWRELRDDAARERHPVRRG